MNYNLTNYKNNNNIITKIRRELGEAQDALVVADPSTNIIKKIILVKEEKYFINKGKDNKDFKIFLNRTILGPRYSIVNGNINESKDKIYYQILSNGSLKPIDDEKLYNSFATYIIMISGDNLEIKYKKSFDTLDEAVNKMYNL